MTQLVTHQETYSTMNELLNRIGYIKTMKETIGKDQKSVIADYNTELLDREIELLEYLAQVDGNTIIMRTENFGEITPDIARELYGKYGDISNA